MEMIQRFKTAFASRFVLGLLVLATGALVYWNTLDHGFAWDDILLVQENEFVQDWSNAGKVASPGYFFQYPPLKVQNGARPVWVLSTMLDVRLWGLHPGGHHLTSVLLHAANSLLVFVLALLLARRFEGEKKSLFALGAGLLFAVHPVHTEAVASVGFRADLLCAFFVLSSLALYAASAAVSSFAGRALMGTLSVAAYALGLLSKEAAAVVPLLLIFHDFCFLTDGRVRPLFARAGAYAAYFALWPAYAVFHGLRFDYGMNGNILAFFEKVVSALSLFGRAHAETLPTPTLSVAAQLSGDALGNVCTMAVIFAGYVKLLVLPWPLRAEYAVELFRNAADLRVLLSAALLAGLAAAGVWSFRRRRAVAFALGAFALMLVPVSNIIPLYNLMAERYLYVPSIAFCLGASAAGLWLAFARPGRAWRMGWAAAGFLTLTVYAGLTVARNRDWKDEATLWEVTSRQVPDAARVWYNRGYLAQRDGFFEEARAFYRRALAANPEHIEAKSNLMSLEPAVRVLEETKDDKHAALQFNRGVALMKLQRWSEAAAIFDDMVRKGITRGASWNKVRMALAECRAAEGDLPAVERALVQIGDRDMRRKTLASTADTFRRLGRPDVAEKHYRKALEIKPDSIDHAFGLAVAMHHQGRAAEALALVEDLLARDGRRAALHHTHGVLLAGFSELDRARAAFGRALEIQPGYAEAHYDLGVVFQRMGRNDDAIRSYERALKSDPANVAAMNNLGGCYMRAGDPAQAEGWLLRAVQADPTRSGPLVNLGVLRRGQGRAAEAMPLFQKALRLDPQDSMAYFNLGRCFFEQGENAKAERELVNAVSLNPALADGHYLLGVIFWQTNRAPLAEQAAAAALRVDPNHPGALSLLQEMRGR